MPLRNKDKTPLYHSHIYFSAFAESLATNRHLRKLLLTIDKMVLNSEGPPTNSKFVLDPEENVLSPTATLGLELVKDRIRDEQNELTMGGNNSEKGVVRTGKIRAAACNVSELKEIRKKIVDIFKIALPSEVMNQKVLHNFSFTTDTSILTALSEKHNNTKANAVGFGTAHHLQHFLLANNSNLKQEPCQLRHTPTFFISILQCCNSILAPSPQHYLRKEWKEYRNATPPPFPKSPSNPQQHAIKTERLQGQRDRVLKNLTHLKCSKNSTERGQNWMKCNSTVSSKNLRL